MTVAGGVRAGVGAIRHPGRWLAEVTAGGPVFPLVVLFGLNAVDELDRTAEPGDRLLVGPSDLRRTWYSDVFIYWLFPELDPATYYIEMDPGLANAEGSSLAGDVASADWVILTGLWDGWMEPNSSMDFGSDAPNRASVWLKTSAPCEYWPFVSSAATSTSSAASSSSVVPPCRPAKVAPSCWSMK